MALLAIHGKKNFFNKGLPQTNCKKTFQFFFLQISLGNIISILDEIAPYPLLSIINYFNFEPTR